ncbi:MAG: shikimate dehydrogenase [Erysipelotrichales bacterium]|nr:shikimate dehydrogenase [Erysipelotrichales bacterium]
MRYGLIGEKLGHSFSKEIHEELQPYSYDLIPLNEEEFHTFMRNKDFTGINVTIPYKQAVIPYLDEIDENAKKIHAVNCIVNHHGTLKGYNTDYQGLQYMIRKHKIECAHKKVAILGSGGTSHTAYHVMKDMGASHIFTVSRSEKEDHLTYEELYRIADQIDIIVNTTPCGMYPNNHTTAVSLDPFTSLTTVIDVVFNPLQTTLMQEALEKGIQAIGGLEMLVAQAVYASEYFHDTIYNKDRIEDIYQQLVQEKRNIALIGMPTSGKSTIAKMLGKCLGREVYDIDTLIEERTQMSIPEIFEKYGEDYFREIEVQVTEKYSKKSHCIISCGGGVIKKKENLHALHYNSTILFIDRPLELLQTDHYRPLSNDFSKLQTLYQERYATYCQWADVHIMNTTTLQEVVETIKEAVQ